MLRIAEAQQLYDAIGDPLLHPALMDFINTQMKNILEDLVSAVRQNQRDFTKEARLAGKLESYEEFLPEIKRFAEEQLKESSNEQLVSR